MLLCHTIFTCMYVFECYICQLSLFVTKETKTNFFSPPLKQDKQDWYVLSTTAGASQS